MKEGQTQEPVNEVSAILKKYSSNAIRSVGIGCNNNEYILAKDFWQIIQEILQVFTQPPAPIKTEGEDEKELAELRCWKESAMKVMADIQEIGKELGVKLGESIHDKILPAIRAFKAGYSASLPQSSNLKEGDFITGDFPYKESKSSTEEEKELWGQVRSIVIKHFANYNYPSQAIDELQSKFKISKR